MTKSEVKNLEKRVHGLAGKEDERVGKFHAWLHRDADFQSWISVMNELTQDERMLLAHAIKALSEGASLESLPEAERAAWMKACSLYERLEPSGHGGE